MNRFLNPTTKWQRIGPLGASLTTALALLSCGDSDPLATFKSQVPDWQACDPARVGDANLKQLTVLAQRTRCSDIRVPLDYASPSKGEIKVALLRVKATQASERRTSILINPGGVVELIETRLTAPHFLPHFRFSPTPACQDLT
jgi:hypothetical protein